MRRWLGPALVLGTAAVLLRYESRRPLRRPTQDKLRRNTRNAAMAVLSAAAIRYTESPLVSPVARLAERRRWGLVPRLGLPRWAEALAACVLMDYTLYLWHVLTHKVPLLWRFHEVHHADLDLDASTAVRFHFAEMTLSAPWRAAQVFVIGVSPRNLQLWQTATTVAILFHHSNVRLNERLERWLCRLFMTPRMHGIHHSVVGAERDSNWATILSWPDYLHGTAKLGVHQEAITIGVPDHRDPRGLTLGKLIPMPLLKADADEKQDAPGAELVGSAIDVPQSQGVA